MTLNIDARLMSAQNPPKSAPHTGTVGEGVKAVAIFESRKARGPRAWDELSEIDRAVLLESVRQRRIAAKQKAALLSTIYGLRNHR